MLSATHGSSHDTMISPSVISQRNVSAFKGLLWLGQDPPRSPYFYPGHLIFTQVSLLLTWTVPCSTQYLTPRVKGIMFTVWEILLGNHGDIFKFCLGHTCTWRAWLPLPPSSKTSLENDAKPHQDQIHNPCHPCSETEVWAGGHISKSASMGSSGTQLTLSAECPQLPAFSCTSTGLLAKPPSVPEVRYMASSI